MNEGPGNYNPERDQVWLLLRPWIWIPRLFQILSSLIILTARLWIQGSSENLEVHKKLAKSLLTTLSDLGPCFIKVGQALSTRPDLVRRDWLDELTNLQDNLPPFSHEKALSILKNDLGLAATEVFEEFPDKPIASASLGQVYKARLQGNYWVAVKIQRPDLSFIIRRDLVIIKFLGVISSPFLPLNLGFGLGEIIDEFGRTLFEEIDYQREADNAERFANLFVNDPSITVPKVERMLSSKKVITTSWVDGIKLNKTIELAENKINLTSLIKTGVVSGIRQLLEFGYFHADPHPGNMFALGNSTGGLGHLAYVDFGMMDSISDQDRITLTKAIVNLINRDFKSLALAFKSLGFLKAEENIDPIVPVLEEVLGGALGEEVVSFNFKQITDRFSELMFDYPFRVPARFALIIRAVVSQEGLALRLDPNFKIIGVAYPYVARRLLAGDTQEMLDILMEVVFDDDGGIRLERLESLLSVLIRDSDENNSDLIPIAGAGLKLLIGSEGSKMRNKLLLTLIKDDRLNARDLKDLAKLLGRTLNARKIASGMIKGLKIRGIN